LENEIKSKPKLLIVEDDEESQRFLKFLLSRSFEVDLCANDVGFYQKLDNNKYDLVVMDISLKGSKNGLELIKEIRKSEKYKSLRMVCLTAHAFNSDKDNALKAGADLFLTKPIPNQQLIDALMELLKK